MGEVPWTFRKIPRTTGDDWHTRSTAATGAKTWAKYWAQSKQAFPAAGVITVFPQLALTASVQKGLFRYEAPLIAWCFNLGRFPGGWKRAAARMALRNVDRVVVHSTGEIARISAFLDLEPTKVLFVPLQRAPIPVQFTEDLENPFVVSMGSANRDYATFLKAAEISGLPCKIVASPRSIDRLRIPPNVSVISGLSHSACHALVQQSRFSVVPLLDYEIASGQVTVVESMRMGRAVVATENIGTTDYIRSRWDGTIVPPHDPVALASAMQELWDDRALRDRYARNALDFAEDSLSDAAAARALACVIRQVESER
jgi:glycosyltransferase involved in cell wall biosynthesis